jgi:hypothetical protein
MRTMCLALLAAIARNGETIRERRGDEELIIEDDTDSHGGPTNGVRTGAAMTLASMRRGMERQGGSRLGRGGNRVTG